MNTVVASSGMGSDDLRPRPRLASLTAAAALAFCGYALGTEDSQLSVSQLWLTAAIVMLGVAPAVAYLRRPSFTIPLLPLHGFFYTFAFGIGATYPDLEWRHLPPEPISSSLAYTVAGLLALYAGYLASAGVIPTRSGRTLAVALTTTQLRVVGWAMVLLHGLVLWPETEKIPSLPHIVNPAGWLGLGIMFLLLWTNRLGSLSKIALLGFVLPLKALFAITSGSLAPVALLLVFLGLLYWKCKQRVAWGLVICVAVFVALMYPVRNLYRYQVWWGESYTLNMFEKAGLYASLAKAYYSDEQLDTQRQEGDVMNRLTHAPTFAWVIYRTPSAIPYWEGGTLRPLLTSFVPRFLWPEKPTSGFANEFGRRYGLLSQYDLVTTFNLPWIVEFYANFGLTGVLIGMALCGVLFRAVLVLLASPGQTELQYALGLMVCFSLFYAESNFALTWGGVLLTLVTFSLFARGIVLITPRRS